MILENRAISRAQLYDGDQSMTAGAKVQAAGLLIAVVMASCCGLFVAHSAEVKPLLLLGDKDYSPLTYLNGETPKGQLSLKRSWKYARTSLNEPSNEGGPRKRTNSKKCQTEIRAPGVFSMLPRP